MGANPGASLVLYGNTLYGAAQRGGSHVTGTIFRVKTDGTGFTTLYTFTDGGEPLGGLTLAGNTLYGTTWVGGTNGLGTVFALTLAPTAIPLNIQLAAGAVVLTWNDPASSFTLQAGPVGDGIFTNISAASPYTNAITASQQFFRLQSKTLWQS